MYYSGNRWLTMDEMKVNAKYIYDYLFAAGWTINAVAGLLGNTQTESHHNPAIWEGLDNSDPAHGFGLVQWTPSTKFTNWCAGLNLTPEAMDSNLQRILYEVANGLQWGNDSLGNPPPYSFEAFTHSTETPYTLGMNFLHYYERPLVYNQPIRGTQANTWFEFLSNTPPPSNYYPKTSKGKVHLYVTKRRSFFI